MPVRKSIYFNQGTGGISGNFVPKDNYIILSHNGAVDSNFKLISDYKGQKLKWLDDVFSDFHHSLEAFEKYRIDGHEIEIKYIKLKTASNDDIVTDSITDTKPKEKDIISTPNSADKFGWYDVYVKIGNETFNTNYMYWNKFENAEIAAQILLGRIANNFGNTVTKLVKILEKMYYERKSARAK